MATFFDLVQVLEKLHKSGYKYWWKEDGFIFFSDLPSVDNGSQDLPNSLNDEAARELELLLRSYLVDSSYQEWLSENETKFKKPGLIYGEARRR